ncbi:lectin subunit alpha-like [Haematobia irritans]|uniref:lectin subunit alpha-like n=1 Tax=Haematobia irritans TaxID=7368 RepID=UPI003F4FA4BC
MQLVEILSKEKNDDLIQVLKAFLEVSTNLWLGAIDQFSTAKDFKRSFYWQSGKSMVYQNWSVENPNNAASNEHCSHIWATKANFEWNDNVCTAKMGFICERQTYALLESSSSDDDEELQCLDEMTNDFVFDKISWDINGEMF